MRLIPVDHRQGRSAFDPHAAVGAEPDRPVIGVDRFVGLPHPPVEIAEIDIGAPGLRVDLHRAFETGQCFFQQAFLVQDVAHVHQGVGSFGVQRQHLLISHQRRIGEFKLPVQLGQIVVRIHIIRIELDRPVEGRFGPVQLAQVLARDAQISVIDRVLRIFIDGAAQERHSLFKPAALRQDRTQQIERLFVGRIVFDHLGIEGLSLGQLPGVMESLRL